jgi:hypothetical protein
MNLAWQILICGAVLVITFFGAMVGGKNLGLDSSTIGFIVGIVNGAIIVAPVIWSVAYVRGRRDMRDEMRRRGEI